MKLSLRSDLGGYALSTLEQANIDGTVLDKPFTLLTGPNGSGKSAVLRGIRSTLGLRGERAGQLGTSHERHLDPKEVKDVEKLATHTIEREGSTKPFEHVPVVFSLADLGWTGQPTYLFDSRAASQMASKASFDDDMMYHVSLIAGGGGKVSHGQFVSKTWWEALGWAIGIEDIQEAWKEERPSAARAAVRSAALGEGEASPERWLFLDEPETAIDAATLIIGLSVLLQAAEPGVLRVFCASHSLLFAAGLTKHPKMQVVDLGRRQAWLQTQRIALNVAADMAKLQSMGDDITQKMKASRA